MLLLDPTLTLAAPVILPETITMAGLFPATAA